MSDLPPLIERHDGFDYGYRMRCDCGELSDLTPASYLNQDAMMTCDHCGSSFNFGPAVACVRDENDQALENTAISSFAWYHTSTSPNWPSESYPEVVADRLRGVEEHFGVDVAEILQDQTSRALHIGTYEAAIENMLRRMYDQDDAASQFYLYRVRINVDPSRINQGYRDENSEAAAQISLADLECEGLDAMRYLNTHEAIGTLSLAIHPRVLHSVQSIDLPIDDLALPRPDSLSAQLVAIQGQQEELSRRAEAWVHIKSIDLQLMKLGIGADPEGIGPQARAAEQQSFRLHHQAVEALTGLYLSGVSPVIQQDFCNALDAWRAEASVTYPAWADYFAKSAAVLTRSREVIDRLQNQRVRAQNS